MVVFYAVGKKVIGDWQLPISNLPITLLLELNIDFLVVLPVVHLLELDFPE